MPGTFGAHNNQAPNPLTEVCPGELTYLEAEGEENEQQKESHFSGSDGGLYGFEKSGYCKDLGCTGAWGRLHLHHPNTEGAWNNNTSVPSKVSGLPNHITHTQGRCSRLDQQTNTLKIANSKQLS